MNGRMTTTAALALLAVIGASPPAQAPRPSPDADARLKAQAPRLLPPLNPLTVSFEEIECLAKNVYFEARGEPEAGRVAVAHVTLNRVGTDSFPGTICGVVRQGGRQHPCQFHWYCNDQSNRPSDAMAYLDAQTIAYRVLTGAENDPTDGALYFHNVSLNPAWAVSRTGSTIIGRHIFFRLDGGSSGRQLAQAN